jgi:hypothetical protein
MIVKIFSACCKLRKQIYFDSHLMLMWEQINYTCHWFIIIIIIIIIIILT